MNTISDVRERHKQLQNLLIWVFNMITVKPQSLPNGRDRMS